LLAGSAPETPPRDAVAHDWVEMGCTNNYGRIPAVCEHGKSGTFTFPPQEVSQPRLAPHLKYPEYC
jgi:hypothetical protein